MTPNLTTLERIEEYREAVRKLYAAGGMTREERALALANLLEAECVLRLRAQRN